MPNLTPARITEIEKRCEAAMKSGCDLCQTTKDIFDLIAEIRRLQGLAKHTVTPYCTHCGKKWPTVDASDTDALAAMQPEINRHVASCVKNPLVAEIRKLEPLAASQPALLNECERFKRAYIALASLEAWKIAYPDMEAAIEAAKENK